MNICILIHSLLRNQRTFSDFHGIHFYNISKGGKSVLGNSFDKKATLFKACDQYVLVNTGITYKVPLSSFGALCLFESETNEEVFLPLVGGVVGSSCVCSCAVVFGACAGNWAVTTEDLVLSLSFQRSFTVGDMIIYCYQE